MKRPKITKIEVFNTQPQVHQVTTPSHPEIWDMLLEKKRIRDEKRMNEARSSKAVKCEIYPYPKIDQLISDTIMVGRYGLTALWHPTNHPDVDLDALINGGFGLRVACDLDGLRNAYLFHESQLHRILR